MPSVVHNPYATQVGDAWQVGADLLTYPDGTSGQWGPISKTAAQMAYYTALIQRAIRPDLLVTQPSCTPADIAAAIAANPAWTTADVLGFIQGTAAAVTPQDVARVLADFAIGEVWQGPVPAPLPPTTYVGPDVTNP